MPAKLTITAGLNKPFDKEILHTASIGRSKENIICLPDNPRISRFHALVRCHDGFNYQIVDLGSRNGTFLNDHRIITPTALEPNSLIRLGDVEILFQPGASEPDMSALQTMAQSPSCDACVMACEIAGFDRIASKADDVETGRALGGWFRNSGSVVLDKGGVLDKFLRDGFTAYWIEGDARPSAAQLAFEAALGILEITAASPDPSAAGAFLSANIALHCGRVSWPAHDFEIGAAVGGEGVNSALSLLAAAREGKRSLLMSDGCLATLPDALLLRLEDIGPIQLKGKKSPVRAFTLAR